MKGKPSGRTITADMGIVDVKISGAKRPKLGSKRISFTSDKARRTTSQFKLGGNGVKLPRSVRVGPIFKTKVKRGTLLSRRPLGRKRKPTESFGGAF